MGWFDFVRSPDGRPPTTLDLPLFPLNAVLFPGGTLALRLFEQRYLDMAAACLKDGSPFGICLIESGQEVGQAAQPHPVGTLATIADWDMEQLGILNVLASGGQRFRIIETRVGAGQLLQGSVELLADDDAAPPVERQRLLPLARRLVEEAGRDRVPEPHRYDRAAWLGYRLCEALPMPLRARQKLLELDDALARLQVVEDYLRQRRLLD